MRIGCPILIVLLLAGCNSVYVKPESIAPNSTIYADRGGYTMRRVIKEELEKLPTFEEFVALCVEIGIHQYQMMMRATLILTHTLFLMMQGTQYKSKKDKKSLHHCGVYLMVFGGGDLMCQSQTSIQGKKF